MYSNMLHPFLATIYLIMIFKNIQCTTDGDDCFNLPYYWTEVTPGSEIPNNAVVGGHETNVTVLYVGHIRNYKSNNGTIFPVLPCKVTQAGIGYAGLNGKEINSKTIEVLCGNGYYWEPIIRFNNILPENAIIGGSNQVGVPLYIGRRKLKCNVILVGWVFPYDLQLTVTYNNKVTVFKPEDEYEILVSVVTTPTTPPSKR